MRAIEFEGGIHNGIIQLPSEYSQWAGKSVRVIVLEKESATTTPKPRRKPHPVIAGKGETIGDLVAPVVDEADWERLE